MGNDECRDAEGEGVEGSGGEAGFVEGGFEVGGVDEGGDAAGEVAVGVGVGGHPFAQEWEEKGEVKGVGGVEQGERGAGEFEDREGAAWFEDAEGFTEGERGVLDIADAVGDSDGIDT